MTLHVLFCNLHLCSLLCSSSSPRFSMPIVSFPFSVPGPCVFPGQEVLPMPHTGAQLAQTLSFFRHAHALLWVLMFLPHNLLQARGTRCPEHPPVMTGTWWASSHIHQPGSPSLQPQAFLPPLLLSAISPIIPGNCPFSR